MVNESLVKALEKAGIEVKPLVEDEVFEFKPLKGKYKCSVKFVGREKGDAPWGGKRDIYKWHLVVEKTLAGDPGDGRHLFKQYNNFVFQTETLIDPENYTDYNGNKSDKAPVKMFIRDLVANGIGENANISALTDPYIIADTICDAAAIEDALPFVYVSAYRKKNSKGKEQQVVVFIPEPLEKYEEDSVDELEGI